MWLLGIWEGLVWGLVKPHHFVQIPVSDLPQPICAPMKTLPFRLWRNEPAVQARGLGQQLNRTMACGNLSCPSHHHCQ
jgi:hypothetical protein